MSSPKPSCSSVCWRALLVGGLLCVALHCHLPLGGGLIAQQPSKKEPGKKETGQQEPGKKESAKEPVTKQPAPSTRSRIQKRTYDFKEAGQETEYGLFVSSKYDKARKAPLMVALHGLRSNPQQILSYRGLTDLAEQHGYVVVAPMGYNSTGWYGSRGQKSAKSKPENLGELSEKDVLNVLGIVRKEFNIDEDRIYLMGHSMGGGGAWHLGLKYPDIWAGLAPIAPAIFRKVEELEKIKSMPVILIQGDEDKLVPVAGARRWAEQMKKLGMTYEYIEVSGGGHVDVAMQNMPKIFEFFDKHRRGEGKDKKERPADGQAVHRRLSLREDVLSRSERRHSPLTSATSGPLISGCL